MAFALNPFCAGGFVSVPSEVIDRHLKVASPLQLKVILAVCRAGAGEVDEAALCERLRLSEEELHEALSYWAANGILLENGAVRPTAEPKKEAKKAVRAETVKPDRAEVVRRGSESPEIAYLLQEAQQKLGRALKQSEASLIVWLFDDEGMNLPLLLLLFEHAAGLGNFRAGFLERTAMEWIDAGVTDVTAAEAYLADRAAKTSAWTTVERAFGIPHRKPTEKELTFSNQWVNEWGLSFEMLQEGYNVCMDNTAKLSMPYINTVFTKWKAAGYDTVEAVRKAGNDKKKPQVKSAYDPALAKRSLYGED